MKNFIKMWCYFNEEMCRARSGKGVLCGLNPLFCDMVIKKATTILKYPAPEAIGNTTLEQLCGLTPTGKFFYLFDIKEVEEKDALANYEIELALRTDSLPVHFTLMVLKQDFDEFLLYMMSYVVPELLQTEKED